MSADEAAVLAANEGFYRAFAERDIAAMDKIWARRSPVACVHPGWPALHDRRSVMASWRRILENPAAPRIRCRGAMALLHGETALVLCQEVLADGVMAAGNLFVREDGAWRLAHHHASPIAPEALAAEEPPPRLHS